MPVWFELSAQGEANELLERKWITPLIRSLNGLPQKIVSDLAAKVSALTEKYATTYKEVVTEIHETEKSLSTMTDELTGNEHDMKGLKEFQSLLKG